MKFFDVVRRIGNIMQEQLAFGSGVELSQVSLADLYFPDLVDMALCVLFGSVCEYFFWLPLWGEPTLPCRLQRGWF